MASIQSRMNRGKKYWYIVESRRVNGKPRPIVLECLGSTEALIHRLLNSSKNHQSEKSFSHGAVCALLMTAEKLGIVSVINEHTASQREYFAKKPLRNNLTCGAGLLLAAIGRVCLPASKRAWQEWADTTSCSHLLRINSEGMDSQHFWDLMDCIPESAIKKMETSILKKVFSLYPEKSETLLYDTTNFYTFISSENDRADLAQRGKNKQKRNDLRQIGMALAVTRENYIPVAHDTYRGNLSDAKVFTKMISAIRERMNQLNIDPEQQTIVFDRGCNSKENLHRVEELNLYYVGALTPTHHVQLIEEAEGNYSPVQVGEEVIDIYRRKKVIWGKERTVLVFVSKGLQKGQLRGVYQSLEKRKKRLEEIKKSLANPRTKSRTKKQLHTIIEGVLKGQFMEGLIVYELKPSEQKGHWQLEYRLREENIKKLEEETLGIRMMMTNRHEWSSEKILQAYHGQSMIEGAFKNMKNPYHLAVRPQFHWTDQKIKVHCFICIIGYLLSVLLWKEAKDSGFPGSLDHLLDELNRIRLIRSIEGIGSPGRPKVTFSLEELSDSQKKLLRLFNMEKTHLAPFKLSGLSSY